MNSIFRLFNWSGSAFLSCQYDAFRSIGGLSTNLHAYEETDFVFRLKWRSWKTARNSPSCTLSSSYLGEEQTTVFSNNVSRCFQFPCRDSIYVSLFVTKESWETATRLRMVHKSPVVDIWVFSQGTTCASQESLRLLFSFPAN